MNKINAVIPVVALVALIILATVFIVFALRTYLNSENERFSFFNRFPHELYYQKNHNQAVFFRIFLFTLFAFLMFVAILFATTFNMDNNVFGYTLTLSLFICFSIICMLVLFIIKPNLLTQFKLYSTLMFVFNMMSSVMFGIISINNNVYEGPAHKVLGAFAFLLTLANFVLALNPKLKNWSKLDEINQSNGTIVYKRPKLFWLALSQWLTFASVLLLEVLVLISILLSSLGI